MANYCGDYGCKNCKWCKIYASNDYWTPDEIECEVSNEYSKEINEKISYTDEEIEEHIDRVWGNGEEWNRNDEPLCPYYIEGDFDRPYYD